jgi:hypothetical protein
MAGQMKRTFVSVTYTGEDTSLRVYLNNSDITSNLTIAGGTASGQITGFQ